MLSRPRSVGSHGRMHWGPSCSQNRAQEGRGRHRLSTVIQPLRQSAGEVVDLTVDEDGKETPSFTYIHLKKVLQSCVLLTIVLQCNDGK